MCGIAGIMQFNPSLSIDQERLLAMRESLIHRGPDGAGLMVEGRIGLAHRRLSIIDLAGGHQPMANVEQATWVVSNGEIYNYKALRAQLEQLGHSFRTESDTEVILCAYAAYGEDCVEHFDGMFAFAIWDSDRQKLFLARDRLGIKPLYYAVNETEMTFASEIKALLCGANQRYAFNQTVLSEYLSNRFVAGNKTFFNGIHKLLPGHSLSWLPEEGFRHRHYWQPPLSVEHPGHDRSDYTAMVSAALERAVKSHLVSDVPVGLFLSGGVDSTALAVLMASMTEEPIHTFSVGFSESEANEMQYARLAADSVNAVHREVEVTPDEFFAALPHLIWHEDEPIAFTSSVPLHILSRMAKEDVKVVLTGEGADELFIGYDYRYRVTALNRKLGTWYKWIVPRALRRVLARKVPRLPQVLRRYVERTFLALGCEPRNIFCENFSVFRGAQRQKLLKPQPHGDCDPHETSLRHYAAAGTDTLQCMSHADLQTYLVELLMKQDQMSMAASIESRVPFLDHHLVELVAGIPSRFKLKGWQTKALLRDAIKGKIPDAILKRKKMGFPVPLGGWLKGRFWYMVEEFVLGRRAQARGYFNFEEVNALAQAHRLGKADHGEQLWLLINLEIWQRIFIDGVAPAAIYSTIKSTEHTAVEHSPLVPSMG